MSLVSVRPRTAFVDVDVPDGIHIERPGYADDAPVTVMFCGLVVRFSPRGDTIPTGIDFYDAKWGDRATCATCYDRWMAAR